MSRLKQYSAIILTFAFVVVLTYLLVVRIPNSAQLNVNQNVIQQGHLPCYNNLTATSIDLNGALDVLVWNIYKQSRANWRQALEHYSQTSQLVLLQEVSMTTAFKNYVNQSSWFSSHVDAFSALGVSSGVLTLSVQPPLRACAYIANEPWILLPKSAIYSVFRLSDQRELVVVNLHSVNFSFGILAYKQQIAYLTAALKKHQGPVIFAGDLNTWSAERNQLITQMLSELALVAVNFSPDKRTQFMSGLALDHVYYRQLTLVSAAVPLTDASDHSPMLVKFRL
ncbi:Uncharacterized conserved protein YafD, endonuclease/exonuclease/phosphatase (EEP) superfamily [Colwellia chukchiensis]|uniref:Uncharacterized conserved protein YafD, endonuclease/exonuclease/phosphatase (EEP) superfamily n=1 Tax=Colwellia chukchiensis TaxID=641665 RepID=A0A1H7MRK8_9GAMM|nr:endonuclease/exonuclease/phosphatase family protein [Colwellia chukchiensis]SEL13824.1 Uncharacterized conserved protein YafD, endonuclease/exonuclease/phosphatase (EEP) superfamily [Colwellia chukchiensis]